MSYFQETSSNRKGLALFQRCFGSSPLATAGLLTIIHYDTWRKQGLYHGQL